MRQRKVRVLAVHDFSVLSCLGYQLKGAQKFG